MIPLITINKRFLDFNVQRIVYIVPTYRHLISDFQFKIKILYCLKTNRY